LPPEGIFPVDKARVSPAYLAGGKGIAMLFRMVSDFNPPGRKSKTGGRAAEIE
jgi:hypothetical protein